MFRLGRISTTAFKTFYSHTVPVAVLVPNHQVSPVISATRDYSKKKDCGDKIDPRCSPKNKCRPVEIKPCRPPPASCNQYPSINDCKKKDYLSQCPEPNCAYEEEAAKAKASKRNMLIAGLLLFAASLGAIFYLANVKPPKKKLLSKKIERKTMPVVKNPETAIDIPRDVPYLLIGGGTAAFAAFRAIKSADPIAKVLVVTEDDRKPYMRPPLSKELWATEERDALRRFEFKQWDDTVRSIFYEPEDFYTQCKNLCASENGGVAVASGWSIKRIDVVNHTAYLDGNIAIKYKKCLLAPGSTPKVPAIFKNIDPCVADRVMAFRGVRDFICLHRNLAKAKSIAIIGGGFLGSEMACSLSRKGKIHGYEVTQVFKESGNMGKVLPEYLSLWTTDKVMREGVDVITDTEVMEAVSADSGNKVKLTMSNGETMLFDEVILCLGHIPNTELAENSLLEVDPDLGGYLVNTELQARTDLFVAGDAACFYDTRFGRRRVDHHDHAVVTGRLAGENMTGNGKPYEHQSMFWSDLGPHVGYEAIGIVDSKLPTVGVFAKASEADGPKGGNIVTETDGRRKDGSEVVQKECDKTVSPEMLAKRKKELRSQKIAKSMPQEDEDFGKGVIFYLRDDIVVGIVMWNVFNRMGVARKVLADGRKYEDLNEVAKLFNIHDE